MAPAATTRRSSPIRAVRHGAGWLSETTGWLDVEHGACIAAAVSWHGCGSSGGALQRRLHGFSAGWRLAVLLLLACGACGLSSRRSSCCAEVFAAGWVAWLAQSRAGLDYVTWWAAVVGMARRHVCRELLWCLSHIRYNLWVCTCVVVVYVYDI